MQRPKLTFKVPPSVRKLGKFGKFGRIGIDICSHGWIMDNKKPAEAGSLINLAV